jgi:signal transduction histidine kinase
MNSNIALSEEIKDIALNMKSSHSTGALNNKTILVICKDTPTIEFIISTLKDKPYNVFYSINRYDAVQLAKNIYPDLILMDLDSHETSKDPMRLFKVEPIISTTPFIFLASKKNDVDSFIGSDSTDDYLLKPLKRELFLSKINTFFSNLSKLSRKFEERMEKLRGNITFALPHEFRTSLNGILGFSNMIIQNTESKNGLNKNQTDDIKDMAKSIMDSAKHLSRLAENFLLYSQIQTILESSEDLEKIRKFTINNPKEIISDIISSFEADYSPKKFIQYTENAHLPISFYYFYKIIYELLDNALKFSPNNEKVAITAVNLGNYYRIRITDKGRGLTKEQLDTIGAYRQFERDIYEQQGAGLGLIIAKQLTIIHKGKFDIESRVQEGTSILIGLPVISNSKNGMPAHSIDMSTPISNEIVQVE